jgi:hypothetical protein
MNHLKNMQLNKTEFFKRRNSNGKKTHEKMLSFSGHKGNVNQNLIKIPPHPYKNSYHQKHHHQ